jgi:hypothetical protein
MTVDELVMEIRKQFEKNISTKTGWGKNEVLRQFDMAVATVALKALEPLIKE